LKLSNFLKSVSYVKKIFYIYLKEVHIGQSKLAETLIATRKKMNKQDNGPTIDSTLYKQLIISLVYLIETRPDVMFKEVHDGKSKLAETPIATRTKLNKQDNGPSIDSTLYKRILRRIMYLIATKIDVMYVVSFICIFMESLKDSHWKVGKTI
jgi:hypothetical protein